MPLSTYLYGALDQPLDAGIVAHVDPEGGRLAASLADLALDGADGRLRRVRVRREGRRWRVRVAGRLGGDDDLIIVDEAELFHC